MDKSVIRQEILDGKTALGIELGSTRIKSVLISKDYTTIASGNHEWENKLIDGIWTYDLEDVWAGIQAAYLDLANEVENQYGVLLNTIGVIGVSGMMHGYLVFDKDENLLTPFRTWRNTFTESAAQELTQLFGFNIPQRWSIAHLYLAILNNEAHLKDVSYITTLAGYVHWKLTGEKVMGIGEASGMFPIDSEVNNYDMSMIEKFDGLSKQKGFSKDLLSILPKVMQAGEIAGNLTEAGAKLLDSSATLKSGITMCPPEGDAGTGMVSTNSIALHTGNVSAGTSVFAMVTLEKQLSKVYTEIDMVTTPDGKPVAMVHCNNCTTDLDSWIRLFNELLEMFEVKIDKTTLYESLYTKALEGEKDAGGLVNYNYYSGEPITGIEEGRPLFTRLPDSNMDISNFMRSLLFSSMATLKIGMDILTEKEHVTL